MKVHDDAFMALPRGDAQLANAVFEGTVLNPPTRYASVFPREIRDAGRLSGPSSLLDNEYIVHSVGTSPEQAKWVRERFLARTVDVTPAVAGWNSRRVRHVTSQPLAIDRDVSPPLWYTVDVLAFESERL